MNDLKTIKSIKIQNYMKFDTYTEFSFTRGFNVIIGENNAGKTTLIELINSFLKNDVKFLENLMTSYNEGKLAHAPIINITTYDGYEYSLDTSLEIWKWSSSLDLNSNYISAKVTSKEIQDNINNVFKQRIRNNYKIETLIQEEFFNFQKGLNFENNRTKAIIKNNIDYSIKNSSDIAQGTNIEFNAHLYNSIINKDIGKQKEFLINYLISKDDQGSSNTNFLLIDEIENYLSLKTLREIVTNFKLRSDDLQIIVTSLNPEAIGKNQFSEINIVLVGFPPVTMFSKKTIFCEGPSDRKIFSKIFPNILFISAVGSNILDAAKAYKASGNSFYGIVDGDSAGKKYERIILEDSPNANVHSLIKGTIEDYYNSQAKAVAVSKNCNITNIDNIDVDKPNFLYQVELTKEERKKIKHFIARNFDDFEVETIKKELNTFLAPFL